MNRKLFIDIDTERSAGQVVVAHPEGSNQKVDPALDRGCLCEALVTMIRAENNPKKEADALKKCINHLKQGFADDSYSTKGPLNKGE